MASAWIQNLPRCVTPSNVCSHFQIKHKRCCMVNLMSELAVQRLRGYGLCRSQGIHTSCTSRSSTELLSRVAVKEVVKEVSLCLYRTPCPHLPSTNHVNVELFLQNLGGAQQCSTEVILASVCLRRLRHFWIKHKFALKWLLGHQSGWATTVEC